MEPFRGKLFLFISLCAISTAQQYVPLSGPNVCGPKFYSYCCPGWTRHERFNTCTVPICNLGSCQGGFCLRPNACYCNGQLSVGGCGQQQPPHQPAPVTCTPECQNGGRCIGVNQCSCPYGFAGQSCETDFRTGPCFTVMEDGQCEGMVPGLLCTKALCCASVGQGWGNPCVSCDTFNNPCERGFFVDARTLQCTDIVECDRVPGICQGGECINTIGSYTCRCPEGYTLDIISQLCTDTDECELPASCRNGRCINQQGGFTCDCYPGYQFEPSLSICLRSDEYAPKFYCADGTMYNEDRTGCVLVDPTRPPAMCASGSVREVDPDGTQRCIITPTERCPQSYTLSIDGQSCVPPINSNCSAGYYLENDICVRLHRGDCPPGLILLSDGVTCSNGTIIVCPAGFRLSRNGRMCVLSSTGDCEPGEAEDERGVCVSIPRGSCPRDYTLTSDGITCIHYRYGLLFCPANYELDRNRLGCVPVGTKGCPVGYYPDPSDRCFPYHPGDCPPGFELLPDGVTCFNMETRYVFCPVDYHLSEDGEVCLPTETVPQDQGFCFMRYRTSRDMCSRSLSERMSRFQCCCHEALQGWGQSEDDCAPCPTGVALAAYCGDVPTTLRPPERINFCTQNPGLCPNGECVPLTEGGYQCLCKDGYRNVGTRTCIDIDECLDTNYCEHGMCRNSQGSFSCTCTGGYQLSRDRTTCVDVDECEEDVETCMHGLCLNTVGSYMCDCFEGYKLSVDEKYCHDIDECQGGRMCLNGRCTNTVGSYECTCNTGFELAENNLCEDTNECLAQACGPGVCDNTVGSYRCTCPAGFIQSAGTCTERSRAFCYINNREGRCATQSSMQVTISQCCCSALAMERSLSWGPGCDPCPPERSHMYERLCLQGPGTDSNGININECLIFGSLCENGMCEDLNGNYRCSCNSGFRLTENGRICRDENECAINRRLCIGGNCRNTPGSYICECPDGYDLESASGTCRDIDECLENPCVGGRCVNTQGGFRCECVQPGMTLDESLTICVDNRIGVCWTSIRNGRCEANIMGVMRRDECCATFGRAWGSPCEPCPLSSPCLPGYIRRVEGCEDINECEINPMLCTNGRCINTDGSYQCICNNGLTLDTAGTMCIDVQSYKCYLDYAEGQCFDAIAGIYRKSICCCAMGLGYGHGAGCNPCPEYESPEWNELCPRGSGFADIRDVTELMDGSTVIEDINECIVFEDACTNGVCSNNIGYFECDCDMGFSLDYDYTCIDVDECSILTGVCGNGTCENRPGTFHCNCFEGFASFSVMMPTCEDINECDTMPNICRGGYCRNTHGSFECICPKGQELTSDGMACRDIDECSSNRDICSNGECSNLLGTYRCMCDEGFRPTVNFLACEDMNECDMHRGGCDQICVNTMGSFHCDCKEGYALMGDGTTCRDRDECTDNPLICGGGDCTNEIGSHRCSCLDGFVESADYKMCIDIDECLQSICQFGSCTNTIGGFVCECDFGFSEKEDEIGCTDDDECLMGLHDCSINTVCGNTIGSFTCECAPGFIPVGDICVDVDECESLTAECNFNAVCVNTDGSYQCSCMSGFTGDGRDCQDFDECMHNQNLCQNGQCLNFPGGYRCECDDGFDNNPEFDRCDDINECELGDQLCVFGKCMNYPGSYRCQCDPGYARDSQGGNCTDIDECENTDVYCKNGNCTNLMGGYICDCPQHYTLRGGGTRCYDLREGQCFSKVMDSDRGDTATTCVGILSPLISRFSCCCLVGKGWGDPCIPCPEKNTTEYFQLCPDGPKLIPGGPGSPDGPGGPEDPDRPARPIRPGDPEDPDVPGDEYSVYDSFGSAEEPDDPDEPDVPGGPDPNGDQDECVVFPNLCDNGRCLNTPGSYKCICETPWFEYDEEAHACIDVNECLNEFICGAGTCINQVASYDCACPTGFMFMNSIFGSNCMDVRILQCYLTVNETEGYTDCYNSIPIPGVLTTQKQCCCSRIEGVAWGDDDACSPCPARNTELYYRLCGRFIGKIIDETGMPIDINECQIEGICHNGVCINEDGGFRCECSLGYVYNSDTLSCEDIDECAENTDRCMGRAFCVNVPGNHYCDCEAGFKLTRSGLTCTDINECTEELNICGNGECINRIGSHACSCHRGYAEAPDGLSCIDKNECVENYYICGNGSCINVAGSYECDCHHGFERGDDGHCRDVDECDTLMGRCPNGDCVNTIGSFFCNCMEGYEPRGHDMACQDIEECRDIPRICADGFCRNFVGGYRCECDQGFEAATIQGNYGEFCLDIDECIENPNACPGGTCTNTQGSYRCNCPPGYVLSIDSRICIDMRRGPCFEVFVDQQCLNSRSNNVTMSACCCSMGAGWGFPCEVCPQEGTDAFNEMCPHGPGYSLEGSKEGYSDIDECKMFPAECVNGNCINTDGSFRCVCGPGRQLDSTGKICEDIDECAIQVNICGRNSTCLNTPGSFQCLCGDGFQTGRGGRCEDINECRRGRNLCAFRCENLPGSYRCICPRGFALTEDGRLCQDFDECSSRENNCRYDCRNLIGKFMCVCIEGYEAIGGDGNNCRDIDECSTRHGLCENGVCMNVPGSYQCVCEPGYVATPDNSECVDQRRDKCYGVLHQGGCQSAPLGFPSITMEQCCCNGGKAWGDGCESCPVFGTSEYLDLCDTPLPPTIDICASVLGLCENGLCLSGNGGFICQCNPGYMISRDGTRCIDKDECDSNMCSHECRNTPGSFKCLCPRGYVLNYDMVTCEDEDECIENENLCGAFGTCQNTPGGYRCECQRSFRPDTSGTMCIDIDECREQPHRCQYECQNTIGGFTCTCPDGYIQNRWGQCGDQNECATPGTCGSAQCYNTQGSYQCSCQNGFILDQQSLQCNDINECLGYGYGGQSPCQNGCQNTPGSFTCGCPSGYYSFSQGSCFQTYGQDSEVPCYSCEPQRRQRRDADPSEDLPGVISNNTVILIRVPLHKAKSNARLLKLTSGYTPSIGYFRYHILSGNDEGVFRTDSKKEGRALLRFDQTLSKPATYSLDIEGRIVEGDEGLAVENGDKTVVTEPIELLVEIEVYE